MNFLLDILKIGGPYARLAFLNASTVSREQNVEHLKDEDIFRIIVMLIGQIFGNGMQINYFQELI